MFDEYQLDTRHALDSRGVMPLQETKQSAGSSVRQLVPATGIVRSDTTPTAANAAQIVRITTGIRRGVNVHSISSGHSKGGSGAQRPPAFEYHS